MLMRFSGLVFGFFSLSSALVSLRFSVAGDVVERVGLEDDL